MHWYEMNLGGRGCTNSAVSQVCRPERIAEVAKYLEQVGKSGVIARGFGSSYADQAINTGGAVMMSGRLDHIHSFDEKTGELICEPGVTLETITELYAPRGFMLATATRSGQHTLGGAIAANIIGQNGHKRMSFAKSVNWVDVVLWNGKTVRAGAAENEDLFKAVVGGQGLIGFISLISITLLKRPEENVAVEKKRLSNLNELLEALKTARKTADFCMAWIDTSARTDAIGRSVLTTASFTSDAKVAPLFSLPRFKLPLPHIALQAASLPFFKNLRYRFFSSNVKKVEKYEEFLYPSDNVRVFSSKGVYQLQVSFSEAEGPQAMRRILTELSQTRVSACRAVLTMTKEDSLSYLGTVLRGYTLNLDFIRRKGLEDFLKHLITVVSEHNGRVSLQNDALLEPRNISMMYKYSEKFIKTVNTFDPQRKFNSDFGRRLFAAVKEEKNEQ